MKKGQKPLATLYTVPPGITGWHRLRAIEANLKHTDRIMLKVAICIRLDEYAKRRKLTRLINEHPRGQVFKKYRKHYRGMLHCVDWSEDWYATMQDALEKLDLPPPK